MARLSKSGTAWMICAVIFCGQTRIYATEDTSKKGNSQDADETSKPTKIMYAAADAEMEKLDIPFTVLSEKGDGRYLDIFVEAKYKNAESMRALGAKLRKQFEGETKLVIVNVVDSKSAHAQWEKWKKKGKIDIDKREPFLNHVIATYHKNSPKDLKVPFARDHFAFGLTKYGSLSHNGKYLGPIERIEYIRDK